MKIYFLKVKKNQATNEKELTDYQKRLREFIIEVQSLYKTGYSRTQIVKMLKTTYKRIRKYLDADPEVLCKSDGRNTISRSSLLNPYKKRIEQLLSEGKNYKETYEKMQSEGYSGKYTILCEYCSALDTHMFPNTKRKKMKIKQYVNRSDIFKYLWSDRKEKISDEVFEKVIKKYPKIKEIQASILDFRKIYKSKEITLLNDFITNYKKSEIKAISGFAGGLNKDKKAVENSVISQYSNGFVEGNNNKLKLIKRQMYGRAKLPLLKAKLIIRNEIFLTEFNHN